MMTTYVRFCLSYGHFNPYPANIVGFFLRFTSAAHIQVHFILDLFMEANNMNPDQTQSDLGPYCLQYRLPKKVSRRED